MNSDDFLTQVCLSIQELALSFLIYYFNAIESPLSEKKYQSTWMKYRGDIQCFPLVHNFWATLYIEGVERSINTYS